MLACDHPCVSHALQKYTDILTTSNMSLTDFVDLIDAGALSVEFYYFCRELMRAQHKALRRSGPGPSKYAFPEDVKVGQMVL